MTGYRITARALERHMLGEQILKELADLEQCAKVEPEELHAKGAKVVFVLEDEGIGRAPPTRPRA